MTPEPGFVTILDYTVEGPEEQRRLIDGLAAVQEGWVRSHPGFLSAVYHASTDGARVVTTVQWATEDDYRNFLRNSDTKGRISAIEEALANVRGEVSSPLGTTNPKSLTFTVHRSVIPSPR